MSTAEPPQIPLVLVIEDDKHIRTRLRRGMEKEGYRVVEVADGEQGLAAYNRLHPDIVLLDALMPAMDGFTCCQRIQKSQNNNTPVLMLIGVKDREAVERVFEVGASDFVTKPIHWTVLRQRVRRLLQQSHLRHRLEKSNQELQAGISQLKYAERALLESKERYALAARGANDGLWDWNLKTNYFYFSSRWKSMLGYFENDIGSHTEEWFSRVHPQDIEPLTVALSAHLKGLTPLFENEHRMLHKDGQYRWMLSRGLAVRIADKKAYRIAGFQTDITQSKLAEAQLLHDALHDGLTGLPNRMLFMEGLHQALLRTKKHDDYLFAVLFIDLDGFKAINDSLGHLKGDQLLIAIARRLALCLRPGDTVARLGGDEFTILLDDIKDLKDATHVADRIQQELALPFDLGGHEVFTAASIGIALSTNDYDRPEDLLRDADSTMYRAKALGKASYQVFNEPNAYPGNGAVTVGNLPRSTTQG